MAPNPVGNNVTTWASHEEEDGTKSRGAIIKMHPAGFEQTPIRTYPWNLVSDNFMITLSSIFLLFVAPVMGAIIGSAMVAWGITCALYAIAPWPFAAANSAITAAAKWAGDRILIDPRNFSYLPLQFFMMVWAPALMAYAWSRQ